LLSGCCIASEGNNPVTSVFVQFGSGRKALAGRNPGVLGLLEHAFFVGLDRNHMGIVRPDNILDIVRKFL